MLELTNRDLLQRMDGFTCINRACPLDTEANADSLKYDDWIKLLHNINPGSSNKWILSDMKRTDYGEDA